MTQLELIIVFLGKAEAALVQYLNTCDCEHQWPAPSSSAWLALEVRQNVVWSAEEYLDGVRHEYIGKYRTLLQAGKVDVRAEAEQIEADNPTDGDGTTLMLRKVEGFVERCIQEAGEE